MRASDFTFQFYKLFHAKTTEEILMTFGMLDADNDNLNHTGFFSWNFIENFYGEANQYSIPTMEYRNT